MTKAHLAIGAQKKMVLEKEKQSKTEQRGMSMGKVLVRRRRWGGGSR